MSYGDNYILTDKRMILALDHDLDAVGISIEDAGGYFAAIEAEAAFQEIGQELLQHQMNGFEDSSASTLSWDNATRTLTLTPTDTDYYWVMGVRYSYSVAKTVTISDTSVSGLYAAFLDSSQTLQFIVNPTHGQYDGAITTKAIVALIYWNATDEDTIILANERHGVVMSPETHHWLHDNIGARYREGGTLSGYTLNTASDAAISFGITELEFYDEDLEIEIEDAADATGQYEQVLLDTCVLPVMYRDTNGDWTQTAAAEVPYLYSGASPQYVDSSYALQTLGNNKYMLYWVVASNDWEYPIKMVPGNQEYNSKNDASEGAATELIAWGSLPSAEMIILYQFVMQQSNGGSVDLKILEITDYRTTALTGASFQPSDHGALTGLGDDDHAQYVLLDGTRPDLGGVSWYIGDSSNADMTIGLTINQAANDNKILAFKSSDVAHAFTNIAETDTYANFAKYHSVYGGLSIHAIHEDQNSAPVLHIFAFGGQAETAKTTTALGLVSISAVEHDGANAYADVTANGNILSVRCRVSGSFLTRWLIDEDGDTWQDGDIQLTNTAEVKARNAADSANLTIVKVNATNAIVFGEADVAYYNFIDGLVFIDDDSNTMMDRGLTINQGAFVTEILAFKGGFMAHGVTDLAETDTYAAFDPYHNTAGGLKLTTFTETGNFVAFSIRAITTDGDTTKGTAAKAPIQLDARKKSGTTASVMGAAENLVVITEVNSTRWLVDEDGTTWQTGDIYVDGNNLWWLGTGRIQPNTSDGSDDEATHICGGGFSSTGRGAMVSCYGNEDGAFPGQLHLYGGVGGHVEFNARTVFINDNANANMTTGLTINQAGQDDEILAFKSSDVVQGYTTLAESDTYGAFQKSWAAYGGLRIAGVAEDHASATNAVLSLHAYGGTAETAKTTSAAGLIDLYAAETSGDAQANITANGNVLSVRCRKGGIGSTLFIIDEDGDTWQEGDVTVGGNNVWFPSTGRIGPSTSDGSDDEACFLMGGGNTITNRGAYVGCYGNEDGTFPGEIHLSAGDTGFTKFGPDQVFINEVLNAKMTIGLTINQDANDDEILAFKSSAIAHGVTDSAETDTYAFFEKFSASGGGLLLKTFAESSQFTAFRLSVIVDNADTRKTTSAEAAISFNVSRKSGTGSGAMGANENLFVIEENAACRWVIDEDGDTWQQGGGTFAGNLVIETQASGLFGSNAAEDGNLRMCRIDSNDALQFGENAVAYAQFVCSQVFIEDTANTFMSQGLTINQGALDNEILAFKSSDVGHSMTALTEADTFGTFEKASATLGGLQLWGFTDGDTRALDIRGSQGVTNPTVPCMRFQTNRFDDTDNDTALALGSHMWQILNAGVHSLNCWANANWAIGDTSINTNMTIGLTIDQGSSDNELFAVKSSDINHGMTDEAEADTYGTMRKFSATEGCLVLAGYGEDTEGIEIRGCASTAITTKSNTGLAPVRLVASMADSASGIKTMTTNANVLAVYAGTNNTTCVFIIDAEGDYFYDGADGGAFDDYHDAELVRAFSLATSKDVIRSQWDQSIRYNEQALVDAGILGASLAEGGLVNGAQLQRLHNGAIWQLHVKIQELELELKQLREEKING